MPEPDILHSINQNAVSKHFAHKVENLLMLPEDYITRIEPRTIHNMHRSFLHMQKPDSRYYLECTEHNHETCFTISPYELQRLERVPTPEEIQEHRARVGDPVEETEIGEHFGGVPGWQLKKTKVIMMLQARRGAWITPLGLVHLQPGDHLGSGTI